MQVSMMVSRKSLLVLQASMTNLLKISSLLNNERYAIFIGRARSCITFGFAQQGDLFLFFQPGWRIWVEGGGAGRT